MAFQRIRQRTLQRVAFVAGMPRNKVKNQNNQLHELGFSGMITGLLLIMGIYAKRRSD